jgi:hypothetical protein
MAAVNIKILPEEMDRLGTSSIKLRDGSGYVGLLSVYHELHCVVSLETAIRRMSNIWQLTLVRRKHCAIGSIATTIMPT